MSRPRFNSREGLDERLSEGSIPGLFLQIATLPELAVTDLETHLEGWSFQPRPINTGPGLSELDASLNETFRASRFHHHSRRMRLELQDPLVSQPLLNNDRPGILEPYEDKPILAIDFEIPTAHPFAEIRTSPGSHEGAQVIDTTTFGDVPVVSFTTDVTCFHSSPVLVAENGPLHRWSDVYITKEPMTISSSITSCKNLFDYIENQRLYGREVETDLIAPGNEQNLPFTARRCPEMPDITIYDADITFVRTDRNWDPRSFSGRVTYNPSLKPVTRPEVEDEYSFTTIDRSKPDFIQGASFLVSSEDLLREEGDDVA
ncbi:hypothetical protein L198_06218 [Cryptococcus wingfieldii CBS 7118]|uniref:Uncharacterized protein n=1 Tax=Cryptococcus wingfieldii CBS 7118 TaxID=1295528 RepID=A0A1E3INM0_9TREE|nr:hypothetical protein L198_06218 [Cryptococcus wingfieldii CBS 7118]ODN90200.1 hypothetical protein L198_06218 [Cryptococcus wingfieldii CBS 7118]